MVKIGQVKVEKFKQGKNTCVKYMELQSTKFIFIGQIPV